MDMAEKRELASINRLMRKSEVQLSQSGLDSIASLLMPSQNVTPKFTEAAFSILTGPLFEFLDFLFFELQFLQKVSPGRSGKLSVLMKSR